MVFLALHKRALNGLYGGQKKRGDTMKDKKIANLPKVTTVSYCQSCHKDFKEGKKCWFAVWDNNIICLGCMKASTISEKEPRVYEGKS